MLAVAEFSTLAKIPVHGVGNEPMNVWHRSVKICLLEGRSRAALLHRGSLCHHKGDWDFN